MIKRNVLLPVFLIFLFCLPFCGCGSENGRGSASSGTLSPTDPPVISLSQPLIPSADGKETLGRAPLVLDISHLDQGYLIAGADATDSRYNLQITDPEGVVYSYFISPGQEAVIPFTGGDGSYTLTAYEQIENTQYAALYFETLDLKLANIFYPFLYPNQYVDFAPTDEAIQFAMNILPEEATDLEVLDAIYQYVTSHITYDEEKARTVEAGYLPDIDETLKTGTGICFDYAALMTAMLRSRGIPCKLQIGYSSEVKHAWIDVYIRSVGWVDQAISFDGKSWNRMDPTFASNSDDSAFIQEYIGDGSNYIVQFSR